MYMMHLENIRFFLTFLHIRTQENGLFVRASVFNPDNHGSILSSGKDGQSRISNKEKKRRSFNGKRYKHFCFFFFFSFLQKRQSCVNKNSQGIRHASGIKASFFGNHAWSYDFKDIVQPKKRGVKRGTNQFAQTSYAIADDFWVHLQDYSCAVNFKKVVKVFKGSLQ